MLRASLRSARTPVLVVTSLERAGHASQLTTTHADPQNWNGIEAPEILASGHHQKIAEWRLEEAKKETRMRRPDLWQRYLQGQGPDNKAKE